MHQARALTHPRWEDFAYERLHEDETQHRFYWLGDGLTFAEKTMTGDRKSNTAGLLMHRSLILSVRAGAWYLNDVDIPPGKQLPCTEMLIYKDDMATLVPE